MARRKTGASSLAKLTRSVARRKRKSKPKPRANPQPKGGAVLEDLWEYVVPGLVSYAVVRLSGRIAYKIGRRKSLGWAKHMGALVPVIVAGGAWYATKRVKSGQPYHSAVTVGGSIAAVQSVAQAYMPRWSWILNDYHMDDVLPMAAQQQQLGPAQAQPEQRRAPVVPPHYQASPYHRQQPAAQPAQAAQPLPEPQGQDVYDESAEVFAENGGIDETDPNADSWGMGADDASLDALEHELGLMN